MIEKIVIAQIRTHKTIASGTKYTGCSIAELLDRSNKSKATIKQINITIVK